MDQGTDRRTVNWELEPEEQYGGKREPPLCTEVPPATAAMVDARWEEYGFARRPAGAKNGQDRGVRDGFEQTRRGAPSLPGESTQIRDAGFREKVADAWLITIEESQRARSPRGSCLRS